MYYNVRQEMGVILDAELLAGVPNYPGMVRLRADVLRQIDGSRFQACLLYTSPSPRDATLSRMPSSA